MLTRNVRWALAFRPRRLFSRHSSSVYPFKNVKAFPFGLSPADAIVQMAPYVSALLMFKQFIGSIGARFLPGLGFEPLRPTRILPVYFPAWVIDGELQASITYNETKRTVLTQFINTYLPGNDFKVLSLVSFWYQQLQHYQLVPFTPQLERQYDTQVHCLPYTISPFSILDITKSWPHGDVKVEEGFQFTPTSVKPNLIAAYPILIPLYLAQYDTVLPGLEKEVNMTVVMEGFSNKGRIFAEKHGDQFGAHVRELVPNAPMAVIRFTQLLDDMAVQPVRGDFRHFVRVAKMGVSQAPDMHMILRKWLDDKLSTSSTIPSLLADLSQGSPTLSGEDERVRDFMDVADRSNVHMWLSLGSKLAATQMVIETMKSATLSRNVHIIPSSKELNAENVMDSATKALEDMVNESVKQRQDTLPAWWKQWETGEHNLTEDTSPSEGLQDTED